MKILLLCSGGFSSSLLVEKLKQAAAQKGEKLEVEATGSEALEQEIKNYDLVLVAPQIRHRFKRLAEIAHINQRPIALISPEIFGRLQAEKLFAQIKELLKAGEN